MEKERLRYLLNRYSSGLSSYEEQLELFEFLTKNEAGSELFVADFIEHHAPDNKIEALALKQFIDEVISVDKIKETTSVRPVHRVHFLRKWGWVAASVVVLLGVGAYLRNTNKKNVQPTDVVAKTLDIAPGKNGAILTLADGRQVVLDSLANGVVANQNGTQAVLKNGQLTYDHTGNNTGEIVYNTMSTPKGRQFQLSLPDGTQVWLNSASSIRYPTVFAGMDRKVQMTGEVYFEVAKNAKMPFRVNVDNKAEIEVLGTHFNVNGYENEKSLNTTLLEGSIRTVALSADQQTKQTLVLQPGQQAQILPGQQTHEADVIRLVNNADIEKIMAWKNGLFSFDDASLEDVMRQLERWYNIDVVYENGVPKAEYYGKINKQNSLQELLHILEKNEVHFRLENGNRLIVSQ